MTARWGSLRLSLPIIRLSREELPRHGGEQFRPSSTRAKFPDTDVREVGRGTMKRRSPSSSLGEHRPGRAKLRGVRIGDGVRRLLEAPPLFRVLEVVVRGGRSAMVVPTATTGFESLWTTILISARETASSAARIDSRVGDRSVHRTEILQMDLARSGRRQTGQVAC